MKTRIGITILLVVIAVGVGTIFGLKAKQSDEKTVSDGKSTSFKVVSVKACDVFTEQVAKSFMGDGAAKGESIPENKDKAASVLTTSCSYTVVPTGSVSEIQKGMMTATLLVNSAIDDQGAKNNVDSFTVKEIVGDQAVAGYGDKASWNDVMHQLNILVGKNWYILTVNKGTDLTGATLDTVKPFADAIKSNLK